MRALSNRTRANLRHGLSSSAHRLRNSSSTSVGHRKRIGATFDIDGVLVRGNEQLPGARDALLLLAHAGVPFIYLTNGGGEREWKKAAKLEKLLGIPVHPDQIVLSHTPLRPRIAQHKDERILVLGCREVVDVARSYGATRPVDISTLAHDDPSRYPFKSYDLRPAPDGEDPIRAVYMLHDPNDWGVEIQITMDVLRGGAPLGSGKSQSIPMFASNPDLTFAGLHAVPRLAAGSFIVALRSVWREVTGSELIVEQVGKPTATTFSFAHAQLRRWEAQSAALGFWRDIEAGGAVAGDGILPRAQLQQSPTPDVSAAAPFDFIAHVGDNPAADVRGANAAAAPWHSILVRTGVWRGPRGSNDARDPARFVVDDVSAAARVILAQCTA